MAPIEITLDQLRGMIGQRVNHQGFDCEVIEVLEDGPSLVLNCVESDAIQPDQFGNPTRRAPQAYTVPVLSPDRQDLHPAFLALDLLE